MLDPNKFDEKAKSIYEAHKEEWEKLYDGKIIAIDTDANDLVSVGDHLRDVGLEAKKECPSHRFLYVELVKIPQLLALGIETMHKRVTFDYYHNDPIVVVTLINPI